MLNDLKLVQGAVAKKDFVPALTHFHISDGRIYGFNGLLAISTPTDLAVAATPKASSFVKAIERIPENAEVVLNVTTAGRLSVKAGKFRAYVECHEESSGFVKVEPKGELYELPGALLPVLKKLSPFMGIDASRPWAMGILLREQSAFATNNIILIEHWLPLRFPTPINIPAAAVKELVRIGIEPTALQFEAGSITFHFPNGAWLRTQLSSTDWPDLSKVLDKEPNPSPLTEEFFDAVNRLGAFTTKEDRLWLRPGILATSPNEGDGALMEESSVVTDGCFSLSQMLKLSGVATSLDFSMWPAPCLFFGDMLRGAIVGFRA